MAGPALPYRFFDLEVRRTERISPAMMRVTFGGEELHDVVAGGRDQRFKLFLPQPGQDAPVLPAARDETWFTEWRAQDPAVRAFMRTYTVRDMRHGPDGGTPAEMDVDFAVHGDANGHGGPATNWAQAARPGDRATVLAPVVEDNGGVDFQPPADTDWVLVTADETALPAVAGILAWLPAGTPARIWIEVPHAEDVQDLPTRADAEITWLVRGAAEPVLSAVRAADLPAGKPYAWLAGESGTVRGLRRHLVNDRGLDRRTVTFTGYWRRGATEEDLLAELA
ncbi:NADPH-dependent ferric siderophore reductase [Streptosporangium nondiastaticum]|uniref:NADPH-dependent ferric siderophore reductase n=1 Tax=Streptosporangium nondiastaticum TaxID=35764 RepID=A0A9X7JJP8_9ACTN|nr:siderophore-interacting protein [Streptosporangium nondiastaticum]PSJ25008.1 NADPH-dependent ferric siderophore reductase [Streptosporangium nondiastaticum]